EFGARPHELDAARSAGTGKLGILGEEPVPGMDRVDLLLPRELDDRGDVQIAADRLARLADRIGLVGLEAVDREPVLVRVDRHCPDAELVGRSEDPDRDLASIGHQQLADLGHHLTRSEVAKAPPEGPETTKKPWS